ncbi:MAG: hypothetical protein IJO02_00190, partial [Clostridia bacterium]|nr:hypothetical protein [Clostridia bacterium]
ILKGMGISILSRISVTNEERLGFLKTAKLDDVDLSRKWYIVRKKSRILLPEYNFFIQSVLEEQKRASE